MRCDDLDALAAWAEDEGGLLDELVWLAVEPAAGGGWRLAFATPTPGPAPDDPRAAFTAETVPARRWTLTPLGASSPPEIALPAEVGGLWPIGRGAGLALDLGATVVEVPAEGWEADVEGEIALPVRRALDPLELTFHGPGPITAGRLVETLAAAGHAVTLHHNWAASGQRFGAAFVRDVLVPTPVGADERLGGAWRVTAAGAPAEDQGGAWLIGQSLTSAAYVTLQRSATSDPALVAALVQALVAIPELEWACSGNALIAGDDVAAWLGAV